MRHPAMCRYGPRQRVRDAIPCGCPQMTVVSRSGAETVGESQRVGLHGAPKIGSRSYLIEFLAVFPNTVVQHWNHAAQAEAESGKKHT